MHLRPDAACTEGDRACVTGWMENAPDENVEFRIYDRFIYLTKVRVYTFKADGMNRHIRC